MNPILCGRPGSREVGRNFIVYIYLMWYFPIKFIIDAIAIKELGVQYQSIKTMFIGLAFVSASIITIAAVAINEASKKLI